jgi:hypothetical protein
MSLLPKRFKSEVERLNVGPYIFTQAVEVLHIIDKTYCRVRPIPDMFAVPGGGIASREQIARWAKDQCYKLTQEM